jgi:hypothetical protein
MFSSNAKRKESDDEEDEEEDELRIEETKKNTGGQRKTIVRLKQSMKKQKSKLEKKDIAKTKKSFAINHRESDDEIDELDSSTVGILDEVHPKKSNLSQSTLGVKGAGLVGQSAHKVVNYSGGTTAYTTYMDSTSSPT